MLEKVFLGIIKFVGWAFAGLVMVCICELICGGISNAMGQQFEAGWDVGYWIGIAIWIGILCVRTAKDLDESGSGRYCYGTGRKPFKHERRH